MSILLMVMVGLACAAISQASLALDIPILLYHRFDPLVAGSTTIRTEKFESQLAEMERKGYHIIPLQQVVEYFASQGPPPPPRSVAITVDDGHRSVYTELLPVVLRHRIPVTLFVYPSAISRASYAMTWQQLRELRATGLFDIQSHTYWHPNFSREKRRLSPKDYRLFVDRQLVQSKQLLEEKLGGKVNLLAWPFGIHDRELEERGNRAGYLAAFTMQRRAARPVDNPMALPRFLITDAVRSQAFSAILETRQPGDSK